MVGKLVVITYSLKWAGKVKKPALPATALARLAEMKCTRRPKGAQRMGFIHQQHAAMALDHLHHSLQRAHRASGAVDGIHNHQARTVLRDQSLQMLWIVMAKGTGHGTGRPHALPQ